VWSGVACIDKNPTPELPCPTGWKYNSATGDCVPPETVPNPDPASTGAQGPCPPSQQWNPKKGACVPKGGVVATGGAGAPRPGVVGPAVAAPGPGDDVESMILGYIKDLLGGKFSAYSPEAVQGLRNKAQMTAQGRAEAERQQAFEDATNRGVPRGGQLGRAFFDIGRGTSGDISQRFQEIDIQKAESDVNLKLKGLDAAQRWLDSKRDYLTKKETNAITKSIGEAQIKLGYAKIASEEKMLQAQIDARPGGGGGGDTTADDLGGLFKILFG
jgi:hypothetical protein